MRAFAEPSMLTGDGLTLALAPALTPTGLETSPSFFSGFATDPQVLAQALLTLADITSTRYFQFVPEPLRDPVLSAHGDRLRAECFSACNGVYARLELLGSGFDGGEIARGTTNVDIGGQTRALLAAMRRTDLLHLDVGRGLTVATPAASSTERPVAMPSRWIRALGNVAESHQHLTRRFTVASLPARRFLTSVPAVSNGQQSGNLAPARAGLVLAPRRSTSSIPVRGVHRLSALKRLTPYVLSLSGYASDDDGAGCALEVELPHARLTLGLTAEPFRGFSGEGSLLGALAGADAVDDADLVAAVLAFEPVIEVGHLSRETALTPARVRAALAVLATSGRVGWDTHDATWFHRELPHDPDRVTKDNPRLVAAKELLDSGSVHPLADASFDVVSGTATYRVSPGGPVMRCTCLWYLRHGASRGPCKHILAAEMAAAR